MTGARKSKDNEEGVVDKDKSLAVRGQLLAEARHPDQALHSGGDCRSGGYHTGDVEVFLVFSE